MEKQKCHCCGQTVSKHKETICKAHVSGLWKAYKLFEWKKANPVAGSEPSYYFTMSELKESQFKLDNSEYARFNDLVRFGLLFRKDNKNGSYGIDLTRCREFFSGQGTVSSYFLRNKITRAIELSDERITIDQVRGVLDIQKEFGEKMTEFLPNDEQLPLI